VSFTDGESGKFIAVITYPFLYWIILGHYT